MGVYSTAAAEQLRESQLVKDFRYNDLLEFAVNTEVANQRMFNAMIELDFHEAVEKLNGSYLTEAETEDKKESIIKKLWEKIINALKRFGEMIATFVKKFAQTLKDLVDANKIILKKFGDLSADRIAKIDKNTIDELDKTDKIWKYVGPADYKFFNIEEIKKEVALFQTKIYGTKTEDIISVKDECLKKINEFGDAAKDNALDFSGNENMFFKAEKFSDYIKDKDYIDKINKNLKDGYKNILDVYNKDVRSTLDKNKKDMKEVDKDYKDAKKNGVDRTTAILEARFTVYNTANAIYAKFLRTAIFATKQIIKNDRAAYCKIGALVLKAEKPAKQEVQHNSAVLECFQIDLLNEQFVDAIFE